MKNTAHRKNMLKPLALLLCFVLLLPCLAACNGKGKIDQLGPPSDEDLIRQRIQTFLTAYNEGDAETVLSCLDAKTRNTFQAMLNLLGGVAGKFTGIGIDLKDLFSLGVAITEDDFMKLQIEEIDVIDSKTAVATTTMNLTGSGVSTIYFTMTNEHDGWYITDMTDRRPSNLLPETNASENTMTPSSLKISNYGTPYNGVVDITYQKNSETYTGLVNTKGEIFYSFLRKSTGTEYYHVADDIIVAPSETGYALVNHTGQILSTIENKKFDRLIGYGNGVVLMYKDNSSISTAQHTYTMIEGLSGRVVSRISLGERIHNHSNADMYTCRGEGVFNCGDKFYNINTKQSFSYYFSSLDGPFLNGKVLGIANSWGYSHYYEFFADGTRTEISKEAYYKDKIELNTGGEYLKIIKDGKISEYKNFTLSKLNRDFIICGDFILIKINGADGKAYFTVIDTQGKQQFEPKACNSHSQLKFSEGRILSDEGEYYILLDSQGNILVTEETKYTYISAFDGGLAIANTQNGNRCYLDINGNPLSIHFLSK